jgi:N-acyl-phosphatidylethanolamine-hydrolysing phospholipase D
MHEVEDQTIDGALFTMTMIFQRHCKSELSVLHALKTQELSGHSLKCRCFSFQQCDFQTMIVIDVDVGCRNDVFIVVVLKIGEGFFQFPFMVIVDKHQCAQHHAIRRFYAFLDERIPNDIPDCLGPVCIAFVFDKMVELMEQILLHGHTKPYELFHTILRVTIYIIVTHFLSACKRFHRPPGRRRIPRSFAGAPGIHSSPFSDFRGTACRFSVSFFMKLRCLVPASVLLLSIFDGCSSYVTRTIWQSISSIGKPIPPAPDTIKAPVLSNANLAVAWVGHATALVQIHDKIFITDPLFSNTIGMIVKRAEKAGLDPSILPKMDFTLISHLHFDHLDFGSLAALPKNGILVFPEGLARYVPEFGFREVDELKPWETIERDGVRITAVPAQHFNGRYGFDRNWIGDRGYTGYVFEYKGVVVFFAGDTGYNPEIFKEIGRRFKIDLAILPIAPSWGDSLGSRVHVSPLGALQIFRDVGARYMMPVHFGTMLFGSTSNPVGPLRILEADAAQEGVADKIVALNVGERRILF